MRISRKKNKKIVDSREKFDQHANVIKDKKRKKKQKKKRSPKQKKRPKKDKKTKKGKDGLKKEKREKTQRINFQAPTRNRIFSSFKKIFQALKVFSRLKTFFSQF